MLQHTGMNGWDRLLYVATGASKISIEALGVEEKGGERADGFHAPSAPEDPRPLDRTLRIAHQLPFRASKTRMPKPGSDVLRRVHLYAKLDTAVDNSLTLVTAAAGYGKTTLLASWLESCVLPNAWLSLDRGDTDAHIFATYLVAAVRREFPDACPETVGYLTGRRPLLAGQLTGLLCEELDVLPERMVLVLDDFHLAASLPVLEIVSWLIYRPLRGLHLIIAGRCDPFLPLASLRAHGELTEIRGKDLRFTPDESAEFLRNAVPWDLPAAMFGQLYERTEGWIAGLRLAAMCAAMPRTDDTAASALQALDQSVRHILSFFTEDVIAGLPSEVQDMLLAVSLPEQFCAELCDAVLPLREGGQRDSSLTGHEFVDCVMRMSLFVTEVDEGPWLKFHSLFRQVLRQLVPSRYGCREIAACNLRIAEWYAEQGMLAEAMVHCLESGNEAAIEQLAADYLTEILNREDRPTLERWATDLPEHLTASYPTLALAKAFVLLLRWEATAILPLVETAERCLNANPERYDEHKRLSLYSNIHLLKCHCAYALGDMAAALELAQLAHGQAPATDRFVKGMALSYMALAMQARGQEAQALQFLNHELEAVNSLDRHRQYVQLALAQVYAHAGDWLLVATVAQAGLNAATRADTQISRCLALCLLGRSAYERGELDVAASHYSAVSHSRYRASYQSLCGSLFGQVAVLMRQEAFDAADELLAQARELAVNAGNGRAMAAAEAFRVRIQIAQGDFQSANRHLERYRPYLGATAWRIAPIPTCAEIYVALGNKAQLAEALACIDAALQRANEEHSGAQQLDALVLRAVILNRMHRPKEALEMVECALPLAAATHARRVMLDYGEELQNFFRVAARNAVCPVFVAGLLDDIASITRPAMKTQPQPFAYIDSELIESLSFREMDVLELLAERLSNREIAERLVISVGTVRAHTTNIYQKLQVSGRRQAVAKATALGILEPGRPLSAGR